MEPSIKNKKFILFSFALLNVLFFAPHSIAETPIIRISILENVSQFTLSLTGPYKIINPANRSVLEKRRTIKSSVVRSDNGGIFIGDEFYAADVLRITTDKDITLKIERDKKKYRGAIDIKRTQQNQLSAINRLDLESYVKGVLYHEVTHKWPMEATKAQAVAIRTYALYQIQNRKNEDFDVTRDIYSQVYGGKSAERYRTNLATQQTKGEILKYNSEVLPAYFHSNSGGHTEDVSELWDQNSKPLKGIRDVYAKYAPNYFWKKNFQSSFIQEKLNENGYKLGLINEISVLERNKSGRIRKLQITTRDGKRIMVPGKKFREIIGPNLIKSNMYVIDMQGYYFNLIGKGWGHGVGMCQWGAYNMARKRFNYKQILKHYYPGANLGRI